MDNKISYCKKHISLSDATLNSYLSWIDRLCKFSGKSKSTDITVKDISEFRHSLLYLSPSSQAVAYSAINTIFKKVLWERMPEDFKDEFSSIMDHYPKQPKKLPLSDITPLSEAEIQKWLNRIGQPSYKLGCSMLYYSGLKLSEICLLSLKAVYPNFILIDGRKIPIPDNLKIYMKRQKRHARKLQSHWFFPSSQNPKRHISPSAFQKALREVRPEHILSGSGARSFRASFIINQLRAGIDPNWLVYLLGFSGNNQLIAYMKTGGLI